MQLKTEIFKFRQIIVGITVSLIIFILITSIFFSALQSSSIFEELLYDIYKIEIDLLTSCETNSIDDSITMNRIHAEDIIDTMGKGLFHYKMIFSESGYAVVNSFYYLIKNKLIQSTGCLVFTAIEYNVIELSIDQIKSFIKESSREQKRALGILYILLLFMAAIILLIFIAASIRIDKEKRLNRYQRELAKNISVSENRIHNLLSSELHDDIGQMLVFLKLKLLEIDSDISEDVDLIIDSVRKLSHNLKIPDFSNGKFALSVEELISQFSAVSSIRIEYTISDFHNELYPDYYPILIFRVIQEYLQNAIKHSNAENIRINMVESAPFLIIRYLDDGIGIESNNTVLSSVKDRAKLLNADIRLETGIGKGLKIVMKIPFVEE